MVERIRDAVHPIAEVETAVLSMRERLRSYIDNDERHFEHIICIIHATNIKYHSAIR